MDKQRRKVVAFWVACAGTVISAGLAFSLGWAMVLVAIGFVTAAWYAQRLIKKDEDEVFLKEHERLMQMQNEVRR